MQSQRIVYHDAGKTGSNVKFVHKSNRVRIDCDKKADSNAQVDKISNRVHIDYDKKPNIVNLKRGNLFA